VYEPPEAKFPMFIVGVVTEKRLFCDLRLAETVDNALYFWVLTMFRIVAVTVAV
jgi:hypothetical protein